MKTVNLDAQQLNVWANEGKTIKWMSEQLNVARETIKKRLPGYKGNKGLREHRILSNTIEQIQKLFSTDEYKQYSEPALRTKAKKLLLHNLGHRCSVCGYSTWNNKPIPLTCDHIDGDSSNCCFDNFRLICANCDRQQPTFGSKNKGRGRIASRKYWLENKQFYNKK